MHLKERERERERERDQPLNQDLVMLNKLDNLSHQLDLWLIGIYC